jgi:phosphohistidine phosphatase SixA
MTWVGIMRHGQTFRPGMDPELRADDGALTKAGRADAAAVAARLADTLADDGVQPSDVTVVCATSDEAKETAAALTDQLPGAPPAVSLEKLDPEGWTAHESLATRWTDIEAAIGGSGRVPVVVGHDPHVSWLLHHLVETGAGGQRGAGPLPLGRGELAMLSGPPDALELRYVLSPSDEKLIAELQDKIRSKMDAAKLLGAFLTALLVFAARELAGTEDPPGWHPWVAGLGLLLLAAATAAYFVTMFRYDELLMPVRMWPSQRGPSSTRPRGFVLRPPSSAAWVLYQNMMHVWFKAFVPATLLGAGGAIAVTAALAAPRRAWWIAVVLSIGVVLAITRFIWRAARPNLGVSD